MIEKIKRILSKILPEKVFNFLILAWRKSYISLRDYLRDSYYERKLKKFKKAMFKIMKYKNIKYYLKIDPKNWYVDNQIRVYWIYEKDTFRTMYKNVKKWDICIDVWANIWLFTNFLPYLVWETWYVYGFEPIKSVYEQNLSSIEKNNLKNVKLYNYALSDSEWESNIHVNYENIGWSSIVDSNAIEWSHIEKIKTIRLDDILWDKKKIDFIKIDVEWFELNVLKWAIKIIKKYHPKIYMEFLPRLHEEQKDGKELLELIKENYNKIYIAERNITLDLSKTDDAKKFFELQSSVWVNILIY